MTEPTCNDSETTKPLTDRLRAAANGESFQLHWLVEAAREIDRLGLELLMIEAASPDEWSRRIARDARARTSEKASSGTPPLIGPQPDPERTSASQVMVNVEYADLLERKVKELQERLAKLYRGLEPMAHAPAGQPVLVDGDLLRELTALAKLPELKR